MKTKLPKVVTIDTRNIYITAVRFLKEYNIGRNEDWVECIINEMENCQIVQSVWTDFETALTSVLLESGEAKKSDFVEKEWDYLQYEDLTVK